jgi:quinol monooxygenase YgiN
MNSFSLLAGFLFSIAALNWQGAAAAQTSEASHAFTYIEVETGAAAKAIELIKKYQQASRAEDDNLEHIVLQRIDRPNHFIIFEGWKTAAAFSKHDQSAATIEFSNNLAPIRISPPDRHVVEPFSLAPASSLESAGRLYMIEHIDFMPPGRDVAPPLVTALAESSRKETGALRYDVFRQLARRNNHYQVVSTWASAADFEAHEMAGSARRFRAETSLGTSAERANLYDQRLYKGL